jgi:outer membrane protein assembly factor BamB
MMGDIWMNSRLYFVAVVTVVAALPLVADDWPQFRGPERTGLSKEGGLLQTWPKDGPKLLWTNENAGQSLSSMAVVGDRLYTMGSRDGDTFLLCLDVNNGKELWKSKVGPMFGFEGNTWGDGPRSTPTVDGDYIYALGGYGDLVCVDKEGKEIWRKDLAKDFDGAMMTDWGYSESVLIDGDNLICVPGSKSKGAFLALEKKTGNPIWQSKDLKALASYASVVAAEIDGVRQYVGLAYDDSDDVMSALVVGVAAKDGALLWSFSMETGDIYAAAPTPIVKGNQVYAVCGESVGVFLLEIKGNNGKFTVKNLYDNKTKRNMKNYHGGVVVIDGHIYGHSEGLGWVCQKWDTGAKMWNERTKLETNASGAICAADDYLYLYSDLGEAVLLKALPTGWDEQGRFTIPKKSTPPANSRARKIWSHPIVANGRLYLRDAEYLFCFDIKQ